MAESLAERLKRIAAEKKAAASKVTAEVTSDERLGELREIGDKPGSAGSESSTERQTSKIAEGDGYPADILDLQIPRTGEETGSPATGDSEVAGDVSGQGVSVSPAESLDTEDTENAVAIRDTGSDSIGPSSASSSTHPLVMEFAELSQALDSRDPEFKTILRKIHQELGKDPDLVTQMSEQEIQQVVTGMIVFANAEIVEPAKAKSVKAQTAAAKKMVINVDDL